MAIRFDAAADYLYRLTDPPSANSVTVTGWLYISTDTNAVAVLMVQGNAGGTVYQAMVLDSTGTTLQIVTNNGSSTGTTSLSVGTWYHIAYTRDGANHTIYLNGEVEVTRSDNISLTPYSFLLGGNGTNTFNGRLSYFKVWDGVLTQDEIRNEINSIRPVRRLNLHAWYPMFPGATERLLDYSGNGRDMAELGTLTEEAPPPVGWGGSPILFPYALTSSDLVIEQTTHGHTSGVLAVSQSQSISIEDAGHNHTAAELALTQAQALSVQSATHNQAVEEPALSQAHALSIQGTTHDHTADDLLIETDGTLTIQSAAHGHTADAVPLVSNGSLVIQGATHNHVADDVAVYTAGDLVIQDASHGHLADDVSLDDGLVGGADGVASVSATFFAAAFLSASSDPAATVSAALSSSQGILSGQSDGSSQVAGDAARGAPLSGAVAALSVLTADAERLRSLGGQSRGAGEAYQGAIGMRRIGGSSDGATAISALLGRDIDLSGSAAGLSTPAVNAESGGILFQDIYFQVTGTPVFNDDADPVTGTPGTWTVPVTVRRGGTSGTQVPPGAAIVKWGEYAALETTDFTGGIILTSDLGNAPYIDVFTVAKHAAGDVFPWEDEAVKPRVRMGNLHGVLGNTVDKWGIAMSTALSDTGAPYIEASNEGLVISDADLTIINGDLYVGDASETNFMRWDTDLGVLEVAGTIQALAGSIEGVLSIGTSGGIYQGSGTFGTPTTGLKIWNDSGVGRLTTYASGVEQVSIGSDGKFYAGAGAVRIDAAGVSLVQGTGGVNSIRWWDSSFSDVGLQLSARGESPTGVGLYIHDENEDQVAKFSVNGINLNYLTKVTNGLVLVNNSSSEDTPTAGVKLYADGTYDWPYFVNDLGDVAPLGLSEISIPIMAWYLTSSMAIEFFNNTPVLNFRSDALRAARVSFVVPKGWGGRTLKADITYFTTTGGGVVFSSTAWAISVGDNYNTHSGISAGDVITSSTANLYAKTTITSPTAFLVEGETVIWRLHRSYAHGSDVAGHCYVASIRLYVVD